MRITHLYQISLRKQGCAKWLTESQWARVLEPHFSRMEARSLSNHPKMTRPSNNETKATSPVYAPNKSRPLAPVWKPIKSQRHKVGCSVHASEQAVMFWGNRQTHLTPSYISKGITKHSERAVGGRGFRPWTKLVETIKRKNTNYLKSMWYSQQSHKMFLHFFPHRGKTHFKMIMVLLQFESVNPNGKMSK